MMRALLCQDELVVEATRADRRESSSRTALGRSVEPALRRRVEVQLTMMLVNRVGE